MGPDEKRKSEIEVLKKKLSVVIIVLRRGVDCCSFGGD